MAKQKPLPGVRQSRHSPTWPFLSDNRPAANGLASNGGDYVASRRSLLTRFALPWLFELHNLQPDFYCEVLFETCLQAAKDKDCLEPAAMLDNVGQENVHSPSLLIHLFIDYFLVQLNKICDDLLRSIIKLCQYSVVFSVFDALFIRWLDFVHDANQINKVGIF